jgi:hypothetical protein
MTITYLQILTGRLALLAQASSPSPSPPPSPGTVETATIEFLKSQFSSLTTSFTIYVSLLSAVTLLFVGIAAWLFNKTVKEARQEVEHMVKAEVRREIAKSIKSRVDLLERVLHQEEVPGLVSVDYVLQNTKGTLPREYRLLRARFPRTKLRPLDSTKFNSDIVVLDLVTYQPKTSKLENAELQDILSTVTDKMLPDSILAVYVRGRFDAIEKLGESPRFYTTANIPVQLLGNVINCAYIAHTLNNDGD